jgi:phosphohistidine phosphatase
MNIYVLRHGLAAKGPALGPKADPMRPLTPKGRKKMDKIAEAMQEMELSFDMILSSPCLRARQTAEIVAAAFQACKRLEFARELAPEAGPEALLARLSRQHLLPENLLLVGHEPHLSGFISLLLTGAPRLQVQLKKGGLCKLAIPSFKGGRRAALEWLLTPKMMLAMG